MKRREKESDEWCVLTRPQQGCIEPRKHREKEKKREECNGNGNGTVYMMTDELRNVIMMLPRRRESAAMQSLVIPQLSPLTSQLNFHDSIIFLFP